MRFAVIVLLAFLLGGCPFFPEGPSAWYRSGETIDPPQWVPVSAPL